MHEQLGRTQALRDREHRLEVGDLGLRLEAEDLDVVDAKPRFRRRALDARQIERRVRQGLADDRDQPQPDAVVAGFRCRGDELGRRELERREVREADVALH